ncbi:ATP-binding protein [Streptomyces sp. NPDC048424]|uniref:ATP-binding protein n=1 Tax=Streptomyces sp. NPDC048424 TaxID=3155265 RepID=UPI00343BBDBD
MSGLRAARHAPSRHAVTGPARQIRPQLVRAAVLPTLAAGLSGAAAVIFSLQLGGGAGDRDARLWPVLTGCALLVVGALAAALLGAQRGAKAVRDRCEALRRSSVRGRQELRTAADLLERGETPPRPMRGGPTGPLVGGDPAGVDEFWLLSQELRGAREQAHATLVRLAGPAVPSDSERKVEVFVNLARRLQSLVHREIALLDDLEDTVEDPDLLKELFHVDHLATRIRRHAENLAVLGGAASRRQWTRPIDLSEVLRSSVAEVEQYTRVKVVPPAGGSVRGHAVADVVHLLAELVENATVFSAPDTDVVLRAERVTAGIAVEVEDRGLGMPVEEQHRMNALLGDPDQISVRHLLADGRIGLFVVSALARRHGIAVELKSNIYGGVLAVLVLPQELLGAEAPSAADAAGGSRPTSWVPGEPPSAPHLEPVPAPLSWPPPPQRVPAPRSGPPAPTTPAVPTPRDPEPGAAVASTEPWAGPTPGAGDQASAAAAIGPEAASVPAPEAGSWPRPVRENGHPSWSEAAATALPAPAADDQAETGPGAEPRPEAGHWPVARDEPMAWPEAAPGSAGDGASATAGPARLPAPRAGDPASVTAVTGSGAEPWPGAVPAPEAGDWPVAALGSAGDGAVSHTAGPARLPASAAGDQASASAVTGSEDRHWPVPRDEPAGWSGAVAGSGGDGVGASATAGPARLPAPRAGEPGSTGAVTGLGVEPWTGTPAAPVSGDGATPGAAESAPAEPWAGHPAPTLPGADAEPWSGSASAWPADAARAGSPASAEPATGAVPPFASAPASLRRAGDTAPAEPAPGAEDQASAGAVTGPEVGSWPRTVPGDGPSAWAGAAATAMPAPLPAPGAGETGPGVEPWTGTPAGLRPGPEPWGGATPGDAASAEPRALDASGSGAEAGPGGAARARGGPRGGEAAGLLPLQRGGEPDGEEERPALPRRRAQQHLAPQLREAPVPRPPAAAEPPLHDPGLMAAFQRGFGLAQSENQL